MTEQPKNRSAERIPFVRVRHSVAPNPDGCRWCGYDQGSHGMQISRAVGLHQWESPTNAQRLARMRARRNEQIKAAAAMPTPKYAVTTDERGVTHVRQRAVPGWSSAMAMTAEEAILEQEVDLA